MSLACKFVCFVHCLIWEQKKDRFGRGRDTGRIREARSEEGGYVLGPDARNPVDELLEPLNRGSLLIMHSNNSGMHESSVCETYSRALLGEKPSVQCISPARGFAEQTTA